MQQDDKPDSGKPVRVKPDAPAAPGMPASPATPKIKAIPALKPPAEYERLAIDSHRTILGSFRTVADRVNADPEFSVMFLINPVMALERYGVDLSPDLKRHVLHTLQHPAAMRTRRDELEAKLREALGEAPKPEDEAWLAALLFERLKLQPLEIGDTEPEYKPPLNAEMLKALALKRPKGGKRYKGERLLKVQSRVGTAPWREAFRRLDLDAPVPKLPPAKYPPKTIALVNLWFYKDENPLVRDVLEYGVLQSRGFPFHSPDSFRQIAEGKKTNAFRTWIRAVRFKERST